VCDWLKNRRTHNDIGKTRPAELEELYHRQTETAELAVSQTTESL